MPNQSPTLPREPQGGSVPMNDMPPSLSAGAAERVDGEIAGWLVIRGQDYPVTFRDHCLLHDGCSHGAGLHASLDERTRTSARQAPQPMPAGWLLDEYAVRRGRWLYRLSAYNPSLNDLARWAPGPDMTTEPCADPGCNDLTPRWVFGLSHYCLMHRRERRMVALQLLRHGEQQLLGGRPSLAAARARLVAVARSLPPNATAPGHPLGATAAWWHDLATEIWDDRPPRRSLATIWPEAQRVASYMATWALRPVLPR